MRRKIGGLFQQPVDEQNPPRPILAPLQLEGELFSLDIPSHRTTGWADFFGSPNDLEKLPASKLAGTRTRILYSLSCSDSQSNVIGELV